MKTNLLVLFAKAPRLGMVKTRLCPPLTENEALCLHRALVADSLHRLDTYRLGNQDCRALIAWSAEPDSAAKGTIPPGWSSALQPPGDLGAKMGGTIEQALALGHWRIVILGSDSPTVPLERIEQAFRRLETHDVVLGPATDGGYYLIGVRRYMARMFTGIDWGSERVLEQTKAALVDAEASLHLLEAWSDVDRAEDLERLKAQVFAARATEPAAFAHLGRFFDP